MSETMSVQPTEDTEPEVKQKKKRGISPTQLSLKELRKRGMTAQVVEHWNAFAKPFGRRVDLFGCIDIVALTSTGIVGIQACAGSSHSARRTKTLLEPRVAEWVRAGGHFEIWSWTKRPNGRWELRAELLDSTILSHAAHVEGKDGDVA